MSLFFAYPMMLWGLTAGAIPLLIHLLRRRGARLQVLPTLRFLVESHRRRLFNIRFQDLLLLILRTLLIILLVLALAGPRVSFGTGKGFSAGWLTGGTERRVVLLDTSRSMNYREGEQSRYESALASAGRLLEEFPSSAEVLIFGFSHGSTEEQRAVPASFSREKPQLEQQLRLLSPTQGPSDILWGLQRATQLLSDTAGGGSIYLFTDMQRTGWEDVLAIGSSENLFPYPITVVDVSRRSSKNLWLDEVALPALPLGVGETGVIQVRIASQGIPSGERVPLQLTLNPPGDRSGEPLAQRELLLTANEPLSSELTFSASEAGVFTGHLVLNPIQMEDPLEEDNRVRVQIPVSSPLEILILMSTETGTPKSADQEKESRFIRSCIQTALEIPPAEGAQPLVNCRWADPVAEAPFSLDSFQAILLYGPGSWSPEWRSQLSTFIRQGGGMLIFWDTSFYPTGQPDAGLSEWMKSLGFEVLPLQRTGNTAASLTLRPENHPAFDLFAGSAASILQPVKLWELSPMQTTGGLTLAEARLVTGSSDVILVPVMAESKLESGRIIACGISLRPSAGNLATSPAWVPLLHQMMKYLAATGTDLPQRHPEGLYPEESDLTPLSTQDQEYLKTIMQVDFSSADDPASAFSRTRGSRELTASLLFFSVLLGLVELLVSNRMK